MSDAPAIDNIRSIKSPAGTSRSSADMSERERKIMRDAFNLFDTDGDGSVTKDELKHVMETLFNKNLSEKVRHHLLVPRSWK